MSNHSHRSGSSSPVPSHPASPSRAPISGHEHGTEIPRANPSASPHPSRPSSQQSNASRGSRLHVAPSASHKPSTGSTGTPTPAEGMQTRPHSRQRTGSPNSGNSRPVADTGAHSGRPTHDIWKRKADNTKSTDYASGTGAPGGRAVNKKSISFAAGTGAFAGWVDKEKSTGSASGTGAPGGRADDNKSTGSALGKAEGRDLHSRPRTHGVQAKKIPFPGTYQGIFISQTGKSSKALDEEWRQPETDDNTATPATLATPLGHSLAPNSSFAKKKKKPARSSQSRS